MATPADPSQARHIHLPFYTRRDLLDIFTNSMVNGHPCPAQPTTPYSTLPFHMLRSVGNLNKQKGKGPPMLSPPCLRATHFICLDSFENSTNEKVKGPPLRSPAQPAMFQITFHMLKFAGNLNQLRAQRPPLPSPSQAIFLFTFLYFEIIRQSQQICSCPTSPSTCTGPTTHHIVALERSLPRFWAPFATYPPLLDTTLAQDQMLYHTVALMGLGDAPGGAWLVALPTNG